MNSIDKIHKTPSHYLELLEMHTGQRTDSELMDRLPPAISKLRLANSFVYKENGKKNPVISDADATKAWSIRLEQNSDNTARYYKQNLERFQLWMIYKGIRQLHEITKVDIDSYIAFLLAPLPVEIWQSTHRRNRADERWRPFIQPPSKESIETGLRALSSFFGYLVQEEYLLRNPITKDQIGSINTRERNARNATKSNDKEIELALVNRNEILAQTKALRIKERNAKVLAQRGKTKPTPKFALDLPKGVRLIPDEVMDAIVESLVLDINCADADNNRVASQRAQRWLLMITLLYNQCLRSEEAIGLTCGDFMPTDLGWQLNVTGKGAVDRIIPVMPSTKRLLRTIRQSDFPILPFSFAEMRSNTSQPVLASRKSSKYSYNGLYALLKDLTNSIINDIAPVWKTEILACSPHWFRHSGATRLINSGYTLHDLQEFLGHASIETTMIYTHSDYKQKHAAASRTSWR